MGDTAAISEDVTAAAEVVFLARPLILAAFLNAMSDLLCGSASLARGHSPRFVD
jgi:hypothetical protein